MITKVRSFFVTISFLLIAFQSYAKDHTPPILTTAAIIEVYIEGDFKGIVLIERGKDPFKIALPGGKVEYGETVESAVRREMMEEVNLKLFDLKQFHVYSDPSRDLRHHSVEVTNVAKSFKFPKAGGDAANAFLVRLEDIPWEELAFDHGKILKDYIEWKRGMASSLINFSNEDTIESYFEDFEILSDVGNWSEIFEKGVRALDISRKESRIKDQAKICAQLTLAAFYQGNYDMILKYAKICRDLSEEFVDPALFIQSLYLESAANRALASKSNNEKLQQAYFLKAIKAAEDALELYQLKGLSCDVLKGKIYYNLGAAYADNPRGNLDMAAHFYSIALQAFENAKDLENQMRVQLRLGKVYLLQKSFEYTQRTIDKARALISNKKILMHSDYLEAQLKLAMNDFVEAVKIAEIGLEKARSFDLKEDEERFISLLQTISNFLDN